MTFTTTTAASSTNMNIEQLQKISKSSNDAGHYVVTAQRAGVVILAKRCSFLSPNSIDVAIVKSNRLEIRQLNTNESPAGAVAAAASTSKAPASKDSNGTGNAREITLPLALDLPIRGRICCLLPFRHPSIPTDLLFFTTANHKYAVISYSPTSPSRTVTHASGTLFDGILRECECGPFAVIDLKKKCIALHLYDGFIQVIPILEGYTYTPTSSTNTSSTSTSSYTKKKGRTSSLSVLGKPFNCRIDERTVLNMCFLDPPTQEEVDSFNENDLDRKLPARGSKNSSRKSTYTPQIVILHQDARGDQHIISHFIDLRKRDMILYSSSVNSSTTTKKLSPPTSSSTHNRLMRKSRVDGGSGQIIPISTIESNWGAVLVLGHRHITFHSSVVASTKTIPVEHTLFLSYCCISKGRYLLGDDRGFLYLLVVEMNTEGILIAFYVEGLGITSIPSALVYLDNEVVYVGSQFGDSQLLTSLLPELVIREEYMNLGPIVDFDLVPTTGPNSSEIMAGKSAVGGIHDDQQSHVQSLIVTCSGAGKEGSIRVVRNGIGVEEQASVDLPGIKGMWNLRANFNDTLDTYLVQSYLGETRILGFGGGEDGEEEGELEEVVFPGLDADVSTLFCSNTVSGVVQVTKRGIRLIESTTWNMIHEWKAEDNFITVAGGNESGQIVAALSGGVVVSLEVNQNGIYEIGRRKMDQEVSCIDLNPLSIKNEDTNVMDIDNCPKSSGIVAVGLWNDVTVRLLNLESKALDELLKIDLGGDTQARSLITTTLGGDHLLLIGLGDGNIVTCSLAIAMSGNGLTITTRSCKKISLGTQSISLTAFQNKASIKSEYALNRDSTCVFATGDRPTIIYTSGSSSSTSSVGKLCFSNLNLNGMIVNNVTPFHLPQSSRSECCLCLADESSLRIGIIDDLQKLHGQTMRLGNGAPRKIAYHAVQKCFAVGCDSDGNDMTNHLRFLDSSTLEEFHSVDLDPYEIVLSISSLPLLNTSMIDDPPNQYIAVGTAYAYPDEEEPTRGRIILYAIKNSLDTKMSESDETHSYISRTVQQVTEHTTNGGVYSLAPFSNGGMLGTVNSMTHLYRFRDIEGIAELKVEPGASHHGHILSLFNKTLPSSPNLAIIGDLMRSISVLEYSTEHHALEEVARDYNANWMTALEMLHSEIYIGAENWNNIFVLKRNLDGECDEARCRLDTQGEFHLGEMVNKFMRGSLIMPTDTSGTISSGLQSQKPAIEIGSQTLYVTVDGSIGSILGLNSKTFAFFNALERAIAHVIPGVGNLSHDEYRAFDADRRVHPSHGIIDGDLVETFLDLKRSEMKKVLEFMNQDGTVDIESKSTTIDSGLNMLSENGSQESPAQGNTTRKKLTIEDVVTRVEEISRLH